jgi:D-arginine dehydrogenase
MAITSSRDFLVIGCGVSGTAAAAELATLGKTLVLEMEDRPGYHSTGRSAALHTPNYGPPHVRRIIAASAAFYRDPPAGFADHPLMSPRGALSFAPPGHEDRIGELLADATDATPLAEISAERACELAPLLRPACVARAAYDPHVMDMDAAAIQQGFLRMLKARGGTVVHRQCVSALERRSGTWRVTTTVGDTFEAPVIINAAGAWVDEIGKAAGLRPIGLIPKRRTAIIVAHDESLAPRGMPAVDDAATESYVKIDAGRLMASLGDATPSPPCDAQPEDLDIALTVDWLERNTLLEVRRIEHSWAGLRSFVHDSCPVVGFDEQGDGFFWLAAQGGYGIMLAAALGRATKDLVAHAVLSADLADSGLVASALAPARCREWLAR